LIAFIESGSAFDASRFRPKSAVHVGGGDYRHTTVRHHNDGGKCAFVPSDLDRGTRTPQAFWPGSGLCLEGPGLKSASDRDNPDSPRPISLGAAGTKFLKRTRTIVVLVF
jgi:hypothetical protein